MMNAIFNHIADYLFKYLNIWKRVKIIWICFIINYSFKKKKYYISYK